MSRPVIVTGRRQPHELLLLFLSVVVGLVYLLGAPRPSSVEALMPPWEILIWAAFLLGSGILGMVGAAWHRYDGALHFEGAAMLGGAAATFAYAVAVFTAAGWRGILPGGITAAWCLANLWRAHQIRGDLRELER